MVSDALSQISLYRLVHIVFRSICRFPTVVRHHTRINGMERNIRPTRSDRGSIRCRMGASWDSGISRMFMVKESLLMNRYHIEIVVARPGRFTRNYRRLLPLTFCPSELPQSLEQRNRTAIVEQGYSIKPGIWSRLFLCASEIDYSDLLKAQLQYCYMLVCGESTPLIITLERGTFIGTVYIRSLKIRLAMRTTVRAEEFVACSNVVIYLLSNLEPRFTLEPGEAQWSILPHLLLPASIVPSFYVRDIARNYRLIVKIGLSLTESGRRETIEFEQDVEVFKSRPLDQALRSGLMQTGYVGCNRLRRRRH